MNFCPSQRLLVLFSMLALGLSRAATPDAVTAVAQWTFDEPEWLYPSHFIDSTAGLDASLVLGLGSGLAPGKFGNALSTELSTGSDSDGRRAHHFARVAACAGRPQCFRL